ncbi:MAG: hypothetical protein DWQ01_18120 [Planctomycetota bacterium]|nr:MAG: hypothetical protein DWQ01_18120 [Planctomycetota bacterium]
MKLRHLSTAIGAWLCLNLPVSAAMQCAMCKEAVDNDKAAGGGIADGISYSILFMLALPLLVLSGFGFAVWRAYRNAPREQ